MIFELKDFIYLNRKEMLCEQMDRPDIMEGLIQATHGNPCVTGCPYFDEGGCLGYKQLIQVKRSKSITPGNNRRTNKQIATELGVSKRQVSKMRKAGEI